MLPFFVVLKLVYQDRNQRQMGQPVPLAFPCWSAAVLSACAAGCQLTTAKTQPWDVAWHRITRTLDKMRSLGVTTNTAWVKGFTQTHLQCWQIRYRGLISPGWSSPPSYRRSAWFPWSHAKLPSSCCLLWDTEKPQPHLGKGTSRNTIRSTAPAKRGCLLPFACVAERSDPSPASAAAQQRQKRRTSLASKKFSWCFLPSLPASDSRSVPPARAGASALPCPAPSLPAGTITRAAGQPGASAVLGRAAVLPLNLAPWVWGFLFLFFSPVCFDFLLDTYCLGSWPALTFAETLPGWENQGKWGSGKAEDDFFETAASVHKNWQGWCKVPRRIDGTSTSVPGGHRPPPHLNQEQIPPQTERLELRPPSLCKHSPARARRHHAHPGWWASILRGELWIQQAAADPAQCLVATQRAPSGDVGLGRQTPLPIVPGLAASAQSCRCPDPLLCGQRRWFENQRKQRRGWKHSFHCGQLGTQVLLGKTSN